MKDNTTISRSSLLTCATENEILVAQILLDLPNMIRVLESGPGFKWGCRRRRSRLGDARPLLSPSFQKTNVEIEERQPQPKAAEEVSAAAASPDTPLAFLPSESDEKSKRSSIKRSREKYTDMVDELTQRRDLLRKEIANVTNYYKKLIAYNSKLKTMRQQVLNSCPRKEEPKMEISRDMNHVTEQPQPLAVDQLAGKFQNSIGPITTQFHYSSCNGLGSVGPLGIPDLNISAEEDSSQPLDMSREFSDRRARFAEARRRRMDIIKIKFPRRR